MQSSVTKSNPLVKSDFDAILIAMLSDQSGNRHSDYYYVFNASGYRIYYSRITGKRVINYKIPPGLIDEIPPKDFDLDEAQLLRFKQGYQTEIKRLIYKISEIDDKLESLKVPVSAKQKKKDEAKRKQQDAQRKREYDTELNEMFHNLFRRFFGEKSQEKSSESETKDNILEQLNIHTKKDLHRWLLNGGHPDKGGDEELCKRVILAAKNAGLY